MFMTPSRTPSSRQRFAAALAALSGLICAACSSDQTPASSALSCDSGGATDLGPIDVPPADFSHLGDGSPPLGRCVSPADCKGYFGPLPPCVEEGCLETYCGKVNSADGTVCEAGDACRGPDSCVSGMCVEGKIAECNDNNPCTDDSCDPTAKAFPGCVHAPLSGFACDDQNPCTVGEACKAGTCVAANPHYFDVAAGDVHNDRFSAAIALEDGFALTGSSETSTAGDYDLWFARVGNDGKPVVSKTLGGAKSDVGRGIGKLAGGDFMVCGETNSKGAGASDAWLVRFDAQGKFVSEVLFGSTGADSFAAMQPRDGGWLFAGFTTTSNARQGWLVATDLDGKIVWQKEFGANGMDEFNALTPISGGWLVTGRWGDTKNGSQVWVANLDSAGNIKWETKLGGKYDDVGFAAAPTTGDGVIVVGETTTTLTGETGAYIARLGPDGKLAWEKVYSIGKKDNARAVVALTTGQFLVIGAHWGGDKSVYDGWLLTVDTQLGFVSDVVFGGPKNDQFDFVLPRSDGFVFGGHTFSKGKGERDGWLVRTDLEGKLPAACTK